ncbi:hypothetical protein B7463_g9925, partial [Scytalidium lignicola]
MNKEGVIESTLTTAPPEVVEGIDGAHDVKLTGVYDNVDANGHIIPTDEELETLPKVAGVMPWTSYLLCAVEFSERASYYGTTQVIQNFIRAPLPPGGNGAGAPARGTQQTAGALGKGTVIASAMSDAFTFLAYALPIFGGWVADAKLGRFKTIVIGVAICGLAHIILVISAIPSVLQGGHAIGPFALGLYMLSVGAALFKPNIAPTVLDQNPHKKPHVVVQNGQRVIIDPEATSESVMLWFYLLINIGAFVGVGTSYLAKYVGFWSAYLIPGILYCLLPPLLYFLNHRLVKVKPGGSALTHFILVNWISLRKAGLRGFGRKGFFEHAKPSVLAASGDTRVVPWTDKFVDDVRRTMGACAIFLFFPIQQINDGGLGAAANAQSASLTSNGVPNDVISNFNPLAIICLIPIVNHIVYPLLRRFHIKFGPIRRMAFGFLIAAVGASGFAILQHFIYVTSPCGDHASTCEVGTGVSPLSLWLNAIPIAVTAFSEVFVNITAYGVAYSRSPKEMRGFVMALSLFMTAISTAISLATADAIQDPNLVWVFAAPAVIGFISAFVFYFLFRHLDNEDFFVEAEDLAAPQTANNQSAVIRDEEKDGSSLEEKGSPKNAVTEL